MSKAYHRRFRPQTFETVRGQDGAIKKVQTVLEKGTSQTFLFFGPSGTGKTTMARIAAKMAGCEKADILEVDAATNSGAEETRKLQEVMAYRPIGGGEKRAIIVDECHRLSPTAWDTLLKATEEPSEHCLWFFCTTDPRKVPDTIKTRSTKCELKLLPDREITKVLQRAIKKAELDIPEGVFDVIVREAKGSARNALVMLAEVEDCSTAKEAASALHTMLETDATIELCRFILKGGSWTRAMALVKDLGESPNWEGTRIVIMNYFGKVALGATSDDKAANALHVLDQFREPYNPSEGAAPFMLSLGNCILQ